MAYVTRCRFCEKGSINHDHDDCAKKYGEMVDRMVLDFSRSNPGKKLPSNVQKVLRHYKYKWYMEYLNRVKESEMIKRQIERIKERVTFDANQVLSSITFMDKIDKHNVSRDSHSFQVKVVPVVTVTLEAVY